MALFHSPDAHQHFASLLSKAFGPRPPIPDLNTWEECLAGALHLSLETVLPSPLAYSEWLREHIKEQHLVPYVWHASGSSSTKPLEGPRHVDALLLNTDNGFAAAFEAKVLSDVSCQVSYDTRRNQVARNLDVLLESHDDMPKPLCCRRPERTLLALLTPQAFRDNPESRLYGWLFHDYQRCPQSLARDLPHRSRDDWGAVAARLGWLTWEDCRAVLPTACGWLQDKAAA